ncbi:uncharacterized protein, partial [Hetaerina americana]|uniref:uncharacterized protein n=1 Tax=Hetaerina americana TaxID=62018 RepID=UPI003A7F2220
MCDKIDFVVCRLCLNSGGLLINIFDKNNKSEFMLEKTIEDLINVKVVEDANYPWLVCSTCMEKLTEFRLFKHRCAECLFVFYNRIQRGCNPVTKDWLTIRQEEVSDLLTQDNKSPGEHIVDGTSDKVWALSSTVESVVQSVGTASVEMKNPYSPSHGVNLMAVNNCNEVNIQFPGEIKKEIEDETIASDAVDGSAVDVRDDMIVVKEEIDTTSGCYVAPEIDTGSSMVTSMHEGDNHWSDNEDSSHLGPPEDGQLPFSFNEEVDIKEELDVDVPREEGCLGEVSSQLLDGAKGQDDGGKDSGVSLLRTYLTSNEAFAQEDIVKSNVTLVRPVKKANHH